MHAAIGEQDFGLADAAGIKDDLAGRGIARMVLVGDAEVEIAERHPDPLAAPAHMDRLALERHGFAKRGDGLRCQLLFETGLECKVAGADNQLAHRTLLLGGCTNGFEPYPLQPNIAEARTIPAQRRVLAATRRPALLPAVVRPAENAAPLHLRFRRRGRGF